MGILAASITTRVAAANEEVRRSDLQLIDNALNQALTLLVCPSLSAIMGRNGALALAGTQPNITDGFLIVLLVNRRSR
jgi:tetrahydromethanopterin S-methyltransferase subunit B